MIPILDDPSSLNHHDLNCFPDGGKPVSDDDRPSGFSTIVPELATASFHFPNRWRPLLHLG